MGVVKRFSVKDQVYNELKQRIHDFSYSAGERINIDNLARELQVSNSPVREAVNMLIKDGLLQNSVNTGPRVVTLTQEDVNELKQATFALSVAGYNLCKKAEITDKLFNELQNRLQVQEALMNKNNQHKYINAALHFDKAFLDVTGNIRIINMFDMLTEIYHLSVRERYSKNLLNNKVNYEEHRKITEAVRNGSDSEVVDLLWLHYQQI